MDEHYPNLGDARVVTYPNKEGKWIWHVEIFASEFGSNIWRGPEQSIKGYFSGTTETKEKAWSAGEEAVRRYYEEKNKILNFKKYQAKNTFVKEYREKDFIDEQT